MPLPGPKYARVDPTNPEAWAQCDRCGFWYNHKDLGWQLQWGGQQIYNTQVLVCERCNDIPNEQLRAIILPPDPVAILNARVPNLDYEEQTPMLCQFGSAVPTNPPWGLGPELIMCDQTGEVPLLLQYTQSR
jgi:hypothetical protein